MITARTFRCLQTELVRCRGLDSWLLEILLAFCLLEDRSFTVFHSTVLSKGWKTTDFVREMKLRGFEVEYKVPKQNMDKAYFLITW